MAIPFPFPGMVDPVKLGYDTPQWVAPFINGYSPTWAWLQTPPPANSFFFDTNDLQAYTGSASVSGKDLNVTSGSQTPKFSLNNFGSDSFANVPVGILLAPT